MLPPPRLMGKKEPPEMSVAMMPAMTATRATPISKSGQLRLSQSMNPILRLRKGNWSNLSAFTGYERPVKALRQGLEVGRYRRAGRLIALFTSAHPGVAGPAATVLREERPAEVVHALVVCRVLLNQQLVNRLSLGVTL